MKSQTKYQPRVERAITKLWVPHNGGEIAFAYPAVGANFYREVGKKILDAGQKVPTGDYTASLLHSAYCSDARNESEFKDVRGVMRDNWFWVFNRNLWTNKGVYVVSDDIVVGGSQPLDVSNLERALRGGKELSWGGIRVSEDGLTRFAPKGSYVLGDNTPNTLGGDGFVVASFGKDGAKKLGEVALKFRANSYTYGLDIQEGQEPELRVSDVGDSDGRLRFVGINWVVNNRGHAFGVLK
jgi:hypothetical protein